MLHLLLDSLQYRWGNGVHLNAPYNWEFLSLGIFQLDSVFTYILIFAGIIPFLYISKARNDARLLCLSPARLAVFFVCLIAYFLVPLLFISDVIACGILATGVMITILGLVSDQGQLLVSGVGLSICAPAGSILLAVRVDLHAGLTRFCNLEMTRINQSEEQPFQRSRKQQTGQFSIQEMAIFGSNFCANQQDRLSAGRQKVSADAAKKSRDAEF